MKRLLATAMLAGLAGAPALAQNRALDVLNGLVGGASASPAGALGALLAPSSAPPGSPGQDLFSLLAAEAPVDEAREIEIGRQLAAVLLGSKPLHADMALQRYVNQLGRWISLHSERPQLPWSFAVLDDPGFNAFAAPGGYVFLTKGLVDRVNEAELAGILAHEIAHVTQRHHLQALRSKARAGAAAQLLASQVRSDWRGALSAQLVSLGRNLYSSGLDQSDEFDADRHGVTLAARAGFDPYGLPAVLQQLLAESPGNALFTLTLATHPPAQRRLEYLEAAMGRRLDALSGQPAVSIVQRVQAPR